MIPAGVRVASSDATCLARRLPLVFRQAREGGGGDANNTVSEIVFYDDHVAKMATGDHDTVDMHIHNPIISNFVNGIYTL